MRQYQAHPVLHDSVPHGPHALDQYAQPCLCWLRASAVQRSFGTSPIAYRVGANEIGTYQYSRWVEPPVEMVQGNLIRLLRLLRKLPVCSEPWAAPRKASLWSGASSMTSRKSTVQAISRTGVDGV